MTSFGTSFGSGINSGAQATTGTGATGRCAKHRRAGCSIGVAQSLVVLPKAMRCSTLPGPARTLWLLCTPLFSLAMAPVANAGSAGSQPSGPAADAKATQSGTSQVAPSQPAAAVPPPSQSNKAKSGEAPVANPAGKPWPTPNSFVGTPLPPPPASIPSAQIARGVWRGTVRIDAALNWSVPLPADGSSPASGDLFGFGAEIAASARLVPVFALGLRWSANPHQHQGFSKEISWLFDARVANRVMLFARGYLPTQTRFQPFAEISGGAVYLDSFGDLGSTQGASWGAALGTDFWLLPGWIVWTAARYRGSHLYRRVGHRFELALGASLHF